MKSKKKFKIFQTNNGPKRIPRKPQVIAKINGKDVYGFVDEDNKMQFEVTDGGAIPSSNLRRAIRKKPENFGPEDYNFILPTSEVGRRYRQHLSAQGALNLGEYYQKRVFDPDLVKFIESHIEGGEPKVEVEPEVIEHQEPPGTEQPQKERLAQSQKERLTGIQGTPLYGFIDETKGITWIRLIWASAMDATGVSGFRLKYPDEFDADNYCYNTKSASKSKRQGQHVTARLALKICSWRLGTTYPQELLNYLQDIADKEEHMEKTTNPYKEMDEYLLSLDKEGRKQVAERLLGIENNQLKREKAKAEQAGIDFLKDRRALMEFINTADWQSTNSMELTKKGIQLMEDFNKSAENWESLKDLIE